MKKLGIITALPAEAKCFQAKKINFKSPIEIERNIFLCISGIGYKSSLYAANELIKLSTVSTYLQRFYDKNYLTRKKTSMGWNYKKIQNSSLLKSNNKSLIGLIPK